MGPYGNYMGPVWENQPTFIVQKKKQTFTHFYTNDSAVPAHLMDYKAYMGPI